MAKVYLAVHKDVPNLKVVLKVLSDSRLAQRFKQEADKLALLDKNPNVCKIRHFFNHGDEFVIAMEYIEGPSLEQILKEKKSLPIGEALKIVIDIMSALEPAHSQGIYHRDIKPSNIMFAKNGKVKIIDFGIAKGKTDPNLTILGTAAGTPEYMAPEQFAGGEDIDYSKCDIYAVGIMLYRMLTGELPYKGENEFLLRDSKLFTTPDPPSKINGEIIRDLDKIIIRSIQCEPEKRFDSISEMKAQLEMVSEHYGGERATAKTVAAAAPPRKAERKRPKRIKQKRSRTVPAIVVTAIILAAAFALLKFTPAGDMTGLSFFSSSPPAEEAGNTGPENEAQDGVEASAQDIASGSASSGGRDASTADEDTEDRRITPEPAASSPPATEPVSIPATGLLKVLSRPGYSDVYIDGVLQKEQTPFTFTLPVGRHVIKIVKVIDGVEHEYTETVIITRDTEKRINKRWSED